MSRDDVIQVGNKVRCDDWKNTFITVTAVGTESFLAWDEVAGREQPYPIRGTWRLEPQVAYVANVYGPHLGVIQHPSRSLADDLGGGSRLGVLTVMTDGSATYEDTRKSYQEGK